MCILKMTNSERVVSLFAILTLSAAAIFLCAASATADEIETGGPPAAPLALDVVPLEAPAVHPAQWFPPGAVDGDCAFERRYRHGEVVGSYLRQMLDVERRDIGAEGRITPEVDLDCFAGGDVASIASQNDGYAAYVAHSLGWLAGDPALRRAGVAQAANRLRLEEARRVRFADPLYFVATVAESQGNYACGWDLMSEALNYGLASAWRSIERLERGEAPSSVPQGCTVYFGERN